MRAGTLIALAIVALAVFVSVGRRQRPAPSAPAREEAGWTGSSKPHDVIVARQELMEHIEELMEPIDMLTVGQDAPADRLRQNAEVIGAMLTALPHLFPPTTNRYDPKTLLPETIALPRVWQEFDSFYALANASKEAAGRMAEAKSPEERVAGSKALRATCDGCHELFLRKYLPPKVLESDLAFDFAGALPP